MSGHRKLTFVLRRAGPAELGIPWAEVVLSHQPVDEERHELVVAREGHQRVVAAELAKDLVVEGLTPAGEDRQPGLGHAGTEARGVPHQSHGVDRDDRGVVGEVLAGGLPLGLAVAGGLDVVDIGHDLAAEQPAHVVEVLDDGTDIGDLIAGVDAVDTGCLRHGLHILLGHHADTHGGTGPAAAADGQTTRAPRRASRRQQ